MKKATRFLILAMLISLLTFSGCSDDKSQTAQNENPKNQIDLSMLPDGTYTAESSRDEKLGYSKLTLQIKDNKITDVDFKGVDLFGNIKDEDYGSLMGKDTADYKKAQIAVKANSEYARQLIETQSLEKVDAISGATISYNQFVEVVQKVAEK